MICCTCSYMHACPPAKPIIVAVGLLPPINQTRTPSQGNFPNQRGALAAAVLFAIGLGQDAGARRPVWHLRACLLDCLTSRRLLACKYTQHRPMPCGGRGRRKCVIAVLVAAPPMSSLIDPQCCCMCCVANPRSGSVPACMMKQLRPDSMSISAGPRRPPTPLPLPSGTLADVDGARAPLRSSCQPGGIAGWIVCSMNCSSLVGGN